MNNKTDKTAILGRKKGTLDLLVPVIDTSRRLDEKGRRGRRSLRCFSQNRVETPSSVISLYFFLSSSTSFLFLSPFVHTSRLAESRAIIAPLTVHWHGRKRDARRGKLDTGYDRAIKPIYVRISFRARACDVDRTGDVPSPLLSPPNLS